LDDFLRHEQLRLRGGNLQRRLRLRLRCAEVEFGRAGIQIEADLFELRLRRGWRWWWWRGRVGGGGVCERLPARAELVAHRVGGVAVAALVEQGDVLRRRGAGAGGVALLEQHPEQLLVWFAGRRGTT